RDRTRPAPERNPEARDAARTRGIRKSERSPRPDVPFFLYPSGGAEYDTPHLQECTMKRLHAAVTMAVLTAGMVAWHTPRGTSAAVSAASVADTIIALERAALDRWGRGDPQGYIDTFAADITYFDPFTE